MVQGIGYKSVIIEVLEPPLPLSFCMIARNEESNLAKCLDSVRSLAAELIVVDTG